MELIDDDFTVAVGDDTPPIQEQARLNGWKAGIYDFGKAESAGIEHFNPGIVRRQDGVWLIVRRSELVQGMTYGRNSIWACKLKDDRITPVGGPLLKFPDSEEQEQFEDPRAIHWNGQTWIGAVNFTWFPDGSWTGAHQMLGIFRDDQEWTAIARRDPPVGTNKGAAGFTDGKHNKNFTWFFHENKLHLIYMSDPWIVIEFGNRWDEQKTHRFDEGVKWQFGHVRGGTPPILVDGLYYTFFHSSMPWRGRFRRYYMGCIAFESKPPFMPVKWTQEPMLIGSQNDPWQQRKPLVVFPCGALYENDRWFVTFGINDLKCGWAEIPHEDVVKLVSPKPIAPATMLLAEETPKIVHQPQPFREGGTDAEEENENEAQKADAKEVPVLVAPTSEPEANSLAVQQARAKKAREALAAKRATGWRPQPRKRKRKRKILKQASA